MATPVGRAQGWWWEQGVPWLVGAGLVVGTGGAMAGGRRGWGTGSVSTGCAQAGVHGEVCSCLPVGQARTPRTGEGAKVHRAAPAHGLCLHHTSPPQQPTPRKALLPCAVLSPATTPTSVSRIVLYCASTSLSFMVSRTMLPLSSSTTITCGMRLGCRHTAASTAWSRARCCRCHPPPVHPRHAVGVQAHWGAGALGQAARPQPSQSQRVLLSAALTGTLHVMQQGMCEHPGAHDQGWSTSRRERTVAEAQLGWRCPAEPSATQPLPPRPCSKQRRPGGKPCHASHAASSAAVARQQAMPC